MKKIQKSLLALVSIAVVLSTVIIPNPNPNPKDFPNNGNSETTGEQTPGENQDDNNGGQNENKPNCDDEENQLLE